MPTSPTKNFGAGVSAYLPPDHRSFETVVFQLGKPVVDDELALAQDLSLNGIGGVQTAAKRAMPSGWLSSDLLASGSPTPTWFAVSAVLNQLKTTAPLNAYVNGWFVEVDYTGVDLTANPGTSGNLLDLGAGPGGAGVKRTDLVVLEVWRRLISGAPSVVGKSQSGLIWRNGNVKLVTGSDVLLNYADDIVNANIAAETTKRVQIQYRLRVISGVDIAAYPYGMSDPTVVARSVPTNAATPNGSSTIFTYANQSASGDAGLWRAGDGVPSNTLGTVDGYMYCIPLCAVFRRNTTAFARLDNHNGSVASPTASDRPDGLWHNIIAAQDIVDLRTGTSPTGWNYEEVMTKNWQCLLDNTLATEWSTTTVGGGYSGHTVLWADEIGVSSANGGSPPNNGDTAGGQFVGEFDNVRRRFSDRATYETMTVRIPASGAWSAGNTVTINFTSVQVYPYTAINFAAYAPAGTMAIDLTRVRYVGDGTGTLKNVDVPYTNVSGLATNPIGNVTFKLDTLPAGVTTEDILVDVLIAYPPGVGLTKTPTATYGSLGFSLNNSAALPVGAPTLWNGLVGAAIDAPHRETNLQYHTLTRTFDIPADTLGGSVLILPERAESISAVLDNGTPVVSGQSLDVTGRVMTFTSFVMTAGHKLTISYVALRPIPQTGAQYTIFYQARQPQTARTELLGTSLTLIPRYISNHLYLLTAGSGSPGEAYPYPQAYVQTGGVYPTSLGTFTGEHQLDGSIDISIPGFSSSTGFLRVPIYVPWCPAPEQVTFTRNDPGDRDIEDRTFFKSIPGGVYIPNAYGAPLSDPSKHKVLLPAVMELAADGLLGKKGQLVLVVLLRWAVFDTGGNVTISADLTVNTTVASVYRIKGNLINRGI